MVVNVSRVAVQPVINSKSVYPNMPEYNNTISVIIYDVE